MTRKAAGCVVWGAILVFASLVLPSSGAKGGPPALRAVSQSHSLARFRTSVLDSVSVVFSAELAPSAAGENGIRIVLADDPAHARVPTTAVLAATRTVNDTVILAPPPIGFPFARRLRLEWGAGLVGVAGEAFDGDLPQGDLFVANVPQNLDDGPFGRGSPLVGYNVLSPEKTDSSDPNQIPGMSVTEAWKLTAGRPEVLIAVIDNGLKSYSDPMLRDVLFLNRGELPLPAGSAAYDANGDGRFNAADYAKDPRVGDADGDGFKDAADVMAAFSNGIDDDRNGLPDDISGYDFFRDVPAAYGVPDFPEGTHGGDRGEDAVAAAGDLERRVGTCPGCTLLVVRTGDSILSEMNLFATALRYAVRMGARAVIAATGAVDNPSDARRAVEEAYAAGTIVVGASGDELSFHHNYPASYGGVVSVKAILPIPAGIPIDGLPPIDLHPVSFVESYCTNYGPNVLLAGASNECSSEATGNVTGIAGLLFSRALDLGLSLGAGDVLRSLAATADDIKDSCVTLGGGTCQPGWDEHFGYGRPNARRALDALGDPAAGTGEAIPPAVEITAPGWFEIVDPESTPTLTVEGSAFARGRPFRWSLQVAPGLEPLDADFVEVASGEGEERVEGALGSVEVAKVFDGPPYRTPPASPNDPVVTIRLRGESEVAGRRASGEVRRNFAVHWDGRPRTGLVPGFPMAIGASGESSPALVDLVPDLAGALEIVLGTSDGIVHMFQRSAEGDAWEDAPGFPVELPSRGSAGTRDGILGAAAVGDLFGDGNREIVVATVFGNIYAIRAEGSSRGSPFLPGFPVSTLPRPNGTPREFGHGRGLVATPVLEDLDRDGKLEIVVASLDQRLYAFRPEDRDGDGLADAMPGFPVLLRSEAGRVPDALVCRDEKGRPGLEASVLGAPATGILDPSSKSPDVAGYPAIVVSTTELCDDNHDGTLDSSRLYAVVHDGEQNPAGPFLPGWPVATAASFLGTGIPLPPLTSGGNFSPAIAPWDGRVWIAGGNFLSYPILLTYEKGRVAQRKLFSGAGDLAAGASPSFGGMSEGDGRLQLVIPTAELVGETPQPRVFSHWLVHWDVGEGGEQRLRAPMEDLQFFMNPTIADVDGDGRQESVSSSGGYLVHARDLTGGESPDWPKFTMRWQSASPTIGDIDGDGFLDVVQATREGDLFAWKTDGSVCRATDGSFAGEWWTYHHDEHRSGRYGNDTIPPARIRDLTATPRDGGAVTLAWTAPGNDGPCGRAAAYDLRVSFDPAADLRVPAAFNAAEPVTISLEPRAAGDRESFTFTPAPGAVAFAMRARDAEGNRGPPGASNEPRPPAPTRGSSRGGCAGLGGEGSIAPNLLWLAVLLAVARRRGAAARTMKPCSDVHL